MHSRSQTLCGYVELQQGILRNILYWQHKTKGSTEKCGNLKTSDLAVFCNIFQTDQWKKKSGEGLFTDRTRGNDFKLARGEI